MSEPTFYSDDYWMRQALSLAEQAEAIDEIPVGALVIKNNQVIGRGFNRSITHHDPTAHAEIQAIRQAAKAIENYRLTDCTLYVTLEPCVMCAMALVHARVHRVVFGAYDQKTGAAGSVFETLRDPRNNHQPMISGGVLAEVCSEKLSNFFKERRRQKKTVKNKPVS